MLESKNNTEKYVVYIEYKSMDYDNKLFTFMCKIDRAKDTPFQSLRGVYNIPIAIEDIDKLQSEEVEKKMKSALL